MDNHKKTLLEVLNGERTKLLKRREELVEKIHESRECQNCEENDLTTYNYNNDLTFISNQIEKLDVTFASIKLSKCNNSKKLGDFIKVGDCVQLHSNGTKTYYYITNAHQYVDPRLGLISENSPLAGKIINQKYGDEITVGFNGQSKQCKLLP